MSKPEGTWTKWQNWLKVIRTEIYDLHQNREIWRGLVDRIKPLGVSDSSYFLDDFTRMYVAVQAMGLRRQAETHNGISLGRLLTGLINDSRVVTRERFLASWELEDIDTTMERGELELGLVMRMADVVWAKFTSEPNRDHLDPAVPRADKSRLEEASEGVVRFATKTVAHTDSERPDPLPTFDDLDDALRVIGEIYCRYSILLTGSAPSADNLAPTIQGDWLAPFRRPLA